MHRFLSLTATVMLAACPAPTDETTNPLLEEGFEDALTNVTACADTAFHAWNDAGNVALSLSANFFVDRAIAAGTDHYEETLVIGVDDVDVFVDIGEDANINFCTDGLTVIELDETWTATAGTVELTYNVPPLDSADPDGTFRFIDLTLENDGGDQVVVGDFAPDTVPITMMWGG